MDRKEPIFQEPHGPVSYCRSQSTFGWVPMYLTGIEKGYSFNVGLHIQLLYDDDRVTEKYIHFTDI